MAKVHASRRKTPQAVPSRSPVGPVSSAVVPPRPALPGAAAVPSLERAARLGHNVLQAKLTLGPVADRHEREADAVAREVVRQIDSPAAAAPEAETTGGGAVAQRAAEMSEDELERKPQPGAVQRDEELEDETMQAKALPGAEGGPIAGDLERTIESARSGGKSLDAGVRGAMEPAFAADFGSVRVHNGMQADRLNRSLQARAFTTGRDIFFRSGEYSPDSSSGKELLAHELTHVVQQNGSSVAKKPEEDAESG